MVTQTIMEGVNSLYDSHLPKRYNAKWNYGKERKEMTLIFPTR